MAEEEANTVVEDTEKTADANDDADNKRSSPVDAGQRSKRLRKTADAFVPADFTKIDRSVEVEDGRGTKLGDLDAVRESVEGYSNSAEELLMAHRLLFATKGKPRAKEMKDNILAFTGFLKKQNGRAEEEVEEEDKKMEGKMGSKAYKLNVPTLKKLCDFFCINRRGMSDKDAIVDGLLDFLGAPDETLLKGSAKTTSSKPSKKSDDKDYEVIEYGVEPNESQLRSWTRAYVRCFNLEKVTIKHALEVASEKFGVDVSSKKSLLKQLLAEEM